MNTLHTHEASLKNIHPNSCLRSKTSRFLFRVSKNCEISLSTGSCHFLNTHHNTPHMNTITINFAISPFPYVGVRILLFIRGCPYSAAMFLVLFPFSVIVFTILPNKLSLTFSLVVHKISDIKTSIPQLITLFFRVIIKLSLE